MARGVKTGGRKKGSKNKRTLVKEMMAQAEAETAGKPLPRKPASDLDVMLQIRDFWLGMAAKEQQDATTGGRAIDRKLVSMALELAGDMASKRAPFFHPRLNAVNVTQMPVDVTQLSDTELAELERLVSKASVDRGDPGREGKTTH